MTRRRLADSVAERLRERILSGQMRAGQRLREERLAAEFRVSRTPLREALRRLEEQGLVAVSATQGLQVVQPDLDTLLEAYELRELVDGLAARLSAVRRPSALQSKLVHALEVQRSALSPWNAKLWTEGNVTFHGTIIEAAGNRYLRQLTPVMRLTAQMFYPEMLLVRERAEGAYLEHQAITDSLEHGDADEAERRARAHIRATAEMLTATLRKPTEVRTRKGRWHDAVTS